MAIDIVHKLQIIDISHEDADGQFTFVVDPLYLFFKKCPVVQARHLIVKTDVADMFLRLLSFGNIACDDDNRLATSFSIEFRNSPSPKESHAEQPGKTELE